MKPLSSGAEMSEQDHGQLRRHRLLLLALGSLALGPLALGLLAACSDKRAPPPPAAPAAVSAAADADASLFGPTEKLFFEAGSNRLPADSAELLARVAESARANGGAAVLISAFHAAASGAADAAANAELSAHRADAVRHALEANGVPKERLSVAKALPTAAGTPAMESQRVELRVQ